MPVPTKAFEDIPASGLRWTGLCYVGDGSRQTLVECNTAALMVSGGCETLNSLETDAKGWVEKCKVDIWGVEMGKWFLLPPDKDADVDNIFLSYVKSCIQEEVAFKQNVQERLSQTDPPQNPHVDSDDKEKPEQENQKNSPTKDSIPSESPIPRPDQLYATISVVKLSGDKTLLMINDYFGDVTSAGNSIREKKQSDPRYKYVSMYCVTACKWLTYPPDDSKIYQYHENELKTKILNPLNTVSDNLKSKLDEDV